MPPKKSKSKSDIKQQFQQEQAFADEFDAAAMSSSGGGGEEKKGGGGRRDKRKKDSNAGSAAGDRPVKTYVVENQKRINELEAEVASLRSQLRLKHEQNATERGITSTEFEAYKQQRVKEFQHQEKVIKAQAGEIKSLAAQVETKQKEAERLKIESNTARDEYNKAVAALRTELATVNLTKNAAVAELAQQTNRVDELQLVLNEQARRAAAVWKDKEGKLTAKEVQLVEANRLLEKSNDELQRLNKEVRDGNAKLQEANEDLRIEIGKLKKTVEAREKELKAAEREIGELKHSIGKYKEEEAKYKAQQLAVQEDRSLMTQQQAETLKQLRQELGAQLQAAIDAKERAEAEARAKARALADAQQLNDDHVADVARLQSDSATASTAVVQYVQQIDNDDLKRDLGRMVVFSKGDAKGIPDGTVLVRGHEFVKFANNLAQILAGMQNQMNVLSQRVTSAVGDAKRNLQNTLVPARDLDMYLLADRVASTALTVQDNGNIYVSAEDVRQWVQRRLDDQRQKDADDTKRQVARVVADADASAKRDKAQLTREYDGKMADLQKRIETGERTLTTMRESKAVLEAGLDGVKQQLADKAAELERLEASLRDGKSDKIKLDEVNAVLLASKTKLETEVKEAQAEVQKHQAAEADLTAKIKKLDGVLQQMAKDADPGSDLQKDLAEARLKLARTIQDAGQSEAKDLARIHALEAQVRMSREQTDEEKRALVKRVEDLEDQGRQLVVAEKQVELYKRATNHSMQQWNYLLWYIRTLYDASSQALGVFLADSSGAAAAARPEKYPRSPFASAAGNELARMFQDMHLRNQERKGVAAPAIEQPPAIKRLQAHLELARTREPLQLDKLADTIKLIASGKEDIAELTRLLERDKSLTNSARADAGSSALVPYGELKLRPLNPLLRVAKDPVAQKPLALPEPDVIDIKESGFAKLSIQGHFKSRPRRKLDFESDDDDDNGEGDLRFELVREFLPRPREQYVGAETVREWLEQPGRTVAEIAERRDNRAPMRFGDFYTDVEDGFVLRTRVLPTVSLVTALQTNKFDAVIGGSGLQQPTPGGKLKNATQLLLFLSQSGMAATAMIAQDIAAAEYDDVARGLVNLDWAVPARVLRQTEALIECAASAMEALVYERMSKESGEPDLLLCACVHVAAVAVTLNEHVLRERDDFGYVPMLVRKWLRMFSRWCSLVTADGVEPERWEMDLVRAHRDPSVQVALDRETQPVLSTMAMQELRVRLAAELERSKAAAAAEAVGMV